MCGNTRSWCTSARPAIPLAPSFGRNGENLFALCDQYRFVIASDECYSEIYFRDEAPLGGLEAAVKLGRNNFRNLLMFSIEDSCCIGTRGEIVEDVIMEENSVISMGVYIRQSTPIYDRTTGQISYGRVPAGSVVISGSLPKDDGKYSLYAAIIVKRVDAQTRAKTSLNDLLRD